MQGFFNVDKIGAKGLKDDAFEQAIEGGYIRDLLADLPHKQRCGGKNKLYDRLAAYWFDSIFSLGSSLYPESQNVSATNHMFSNICLSSEDKDPAYTYRRGYDGGDAYLYQWEGSVGTSLATSAAKIFIYNQMEPFTIWADTDGREAIHFKNTWLYLPAYAVHSTIRSIAIVGSEDIYVLDDQRFYNKWRVETGYVRLKDSAGNKVTLTKSSSELLMVEYTFTLVSM